MSLYRNYSSTFTYSYDQATGVMALYYKNSQGETKSFQYIIESVSEQELVIHENQGSLPKGLYEVMAYGDYSFIILRRRMRVHMRELCITSLMTTLQKHTGRNFQPNNFLLP